MANGRHSMTPRQEGGMNRCRQGISSLTPAERIVLIKTGDLGGAKLVAGDLYISVNTGGRAYAWRCTPGASPENRQ